jgi:hypothetical protein
MQNIMQVKSELPSTYKDYCRQQFRWSCGGAHLFRQVAKDILAAKVGFSSPSLANL